MADKVRIWEIGASDALLEMSRFELDKEERIEKWITQNISVLDANDSGLLVIGRQVRTDFDGEIDLLCINSVGDTVIVELKRSRTPREVTAQALDYASWIEGLGREKIEDIAIGYLNGASLKEAFQEAFPDSEYPDIINGNHSIQIVASEMNESTERIIRYLSSKGIDINFVRFQMFRTAGGRELLVRTFTVPPEEAEQNVLRSGSTKKTRPGKTLETRLDECTNDAERDFLAARLSDPKQATDPKRRALLYKIVGRTRFIIRARKSHAHVIQKGRFEGDEQLWKQALSTNKVGFRNGQADLSLQLVNKPDFDFFYKTATADAHSFKWTSVGAGSDGTSHEEDEDD